jgi:hypothetical protein
MESSFNGFHGVLKRSFPPNSFERLSMACRSARDHDEPPSAVYVPSSPLGAKP